MSSREKVAGDGGPLGPFVRVDEDFTLASSVDAPSTSLDSLIDQAREDPNVHVLVVSPEKAVLDDFFQNGATAESSEDNTVESP